MSAFKIWIAPIPNDLTVAKKDARLKWFKPPQSRPDRPTITAAATRCFLSCANDFCYSRPQRIGLSSQQKVRWWLLSNKPWEHTVILSQQQHCHFLFRLFCFFFSFFVSSEHKMTAKMDKMTHSEPRKWLRSNLGWLILENEHGEKGILFLRCLSWRNGYSAKISGTFDGPDVNFSSLCWPESGVMPCVFAEKGTLTLKQVTSWLDVMISSTVSPFSCDYKVIFFQYFRQSTHHWHLTVIKHSKPLWL